MNPEKLDSDMRNGHWDGVLTAISSLKLPTHKLINLYEHIIMEMAELREMDVARTLLKQTQAMTILKQTAPERYHRLEELLARTYLDPQELYPAGNKNARRQDIASEIMREITVVEPSRLLSLLTQSLRFAQIEGSLPTQSTNLSTHYDLFRGKIPTEEDEEETYPRNVTKTIKFSGKSSPEAARFSPDGNMLVIGARDGFIEVYSPHTGKLRTDLPYQANEQFMTLRQAVLCLNFSRNGDYLVAGAQDGSISIFKLRTGECLKDLPNIHAAGVTSVSLSKDDSHILSSSLDGTLQVIGIKSGKALRQFKGHSSYVTSAHYTRDNKIIVSASSDGHIRVWDNTSAQCLRTFTPGKIELELEIHSLLPLPIVGQHQFIVSNKSKTIYLMNLEGNTIKTFTTGNKDSTDFVTARLSPKANFLYAVAEDSTMYIFNVLTAELMHSLKIHEKEVIGLDHHPFRNLLLSFCTDGSLKIWKP